MNKIVKTAIIAMMVVQGAVAAHAQDMRKEADDTYVVNTTAIGKNIKGFKGATPVEIYIKNNKIVKVIALKNIETPKFFERAKGGVLPVWAGMKVSKAVKAKVDGVTGATLSSNALIKNVQAGLAYYQGHQ